MIHEALSQLLILLGHRHRRGHFAIDNLLVKSANERDSRGIPERPAGQQQEMPVYFPDKLPKHLEVGLDLTARKYHQARAQGLGKEMGATRLE